MRVVRRFYFYAVSLISLEVVLWGVITLLNSTINAPVGGGLASLLARGFSQILVGLPIFFLHWSTIRKDLRKDDEEHQTVLRAVFNYGLLMATLIPMITNLHVILRRPLYAWLQVYPSFRNFLAGQTFTENLIAILANLLVFYFAFRLLKADWHAYPASPNLENIRRLFRYLWFLIGLVSLVVGLQQILFSIFYNVNGIGNAAAIKLANGTSVTLISAGIWAFFSTRIDKSLVSRQETGSLLRTIVLFLINLASVGLVLTYSGLMINELLRWILGEDQTFLTFLNSNTSTLATLLPMIVVWIFYSRALKLNFVAEPDVLRRDGVQRLYSSILSLAGNAAVFYGVWTLLRLIADLLTGMDILTANSRNMLAQGFAILVVSLPLWLKTWPKLQTEISRADERADHARQSVVRKTYLYLVIFASVVGLMAAGGFLAFRLINSALGNPFENASQFVLRQVFLLALIALWLMYHLKALQSDGHATQQVLREKHAAYKTVILSEKEQDGFTRKLLALLNKNLPDIPVQILTRKKDQTWEIPIGTETLMVPARLAMQPNFPGDFPGKLVLLPDPEDDITWVGVPAKNSEDIQQDAVRVLRQLAEGQSARSAGPTNSWVIVGYILGAIFGLFLLVLLLSAGINLFS
ncbi:MAG: hypothetical protein CVU46_11320 [Chloroflexi bacterium HGW-Chloroflexi-8]|nr:MAG: hypothetical protein CVU46_11320 [Chloroflexi bacterium HGW-Chloroflexi-8]